MRNWQEDWELCEKATPGPWEVTIKWNADYCLVKGRDWDVAQVIYDDDRRSWKNKYELAFAEGDAQFIAESRQALPYWLNAYRELETKYHAIAKEAREVITTLKPILKKLRELKHKLADHGPEGRNYSNAQYVKLRNRLQKAEAVVEAAKQVYAMAVNMGDFRNGNTCYGVDEGQEIANRQLDKLKQTLDDLEGD